MTFKGLKKYLKSKGVKNDSQICFVSYCKCGFHMTGGLDYVELIKHGETFSILTHKTISDEEIKERGIYLSEGD